MTDSDNQPSNLSGAIDQKPKIDVLFSADQIAVRVAELAGQVAALRLDGLLVIAVLKGSFVFAADLIRAMTCRSALKTSRSRCATTTRNSSRLRCPLSAS